MPPSTPDANFDLLLVPLEGGEGAPLNGGIPTFDLFSDGPLPEIADIFGDLQLPPEPFPELTFGPSRGGSRLETMLPSGGNRNGNAAAKEIVLPSKAAPPTASASAAPKGGQSLWLEGDVLMCLCPDCDAPISVRVWLMIADCWQCKTGIELSEEQEREANRLLEEQQARRRQADSNRAPARRPEPAAAPASTPTPATRPAPVPRPAETAAAAAVAPSPTPRPTPPPRPGAHPVPAAAPARPPSQPRPQPQRRTASEALRQRKTRVRRRNWLQDLLRHTPAWLVALVFHLVVLTLLAILYLPEEKEREPFITLSAASARKVQAGGEVNQQKPDEVAFDLPVPKNIDMSSPQTREAMEKANQEAKELRIDPESNDPALPDLSQVRRQIANATVSQGAIAARDPRVRVDMVQREGGTTLTEAAVARGLRYLAVKQLADGSWGTHGASGKGAGTSLALLPFLGAGQTHLTGRYSEQVARGLRWIIDHQKPNGDCRSDAAGHHGMYVHGQSTIVLCEAYMLSGDDALRVPAQKAIDFTVAAQYTSGGWRYEPHVKGATGELGDTSVFGWQLMAMQAARSAKLKVPKTAFELANQYLDSAQHRDGAAYSYQPRGQATPAMSAEGLLCRIYLGWTKDNPALLAGAQELLKANPPTRGAPNMYYWYYGTQAMHHIGGEEWEKWNVLMRDALVQSQVTSGSEAGSWPISIDQHGGAGGAVYTTSLATCTLEVYYRHLPIFRQIDLEKK